MSRHADPLDRAAELASEINDYCVDEARRRARPEQVQNEDGTWPVTECIGLSQDEPCDEPIEPGRLALGKVRCINCQNVLEKRQKRRDPSC